MAETSGGAAKTPARRRRCQSAGRFLAPIHPQKAKNHFPSFFLFFKPSKSIVTMNLEQHLIQTFAPFLPPVLFVSSSIKNQKFKIEIPIEPLHISLASRFSPYG